MGSSTRPGPGGESVADSLAWSPLGEPMSWERYWTLPEELRAEYSDGRAFVTPGPSFRHQDMCQRVLSAVMPD
jgi:hypothetical protein